LRETTIKQLEETGGYANNEMFGTTFSKPRWGAENVSQKSASK
jgi:hypothetical protein